MQIVLLLLHENNISKPWIVEPAVFLRITTHLLLQLLTLCIGSSASWSTNSSSSSVPEIARLISGPRSCTALRPACTSQQTHQSTWQHQTQCYRLRALFAYWKYKRIKSRVNRYYSFIDRPSSLRFGDSWWPLHYAASPGVSCNARGRFIGKFRTTALRRHLNSRHRRRSNVNKKEEVFFLTESADNWQSYETTENT